MKTVLEGLDQQLRDSQERKRDWVIARKSDRKEILTSFGRVEFARSYYRHKRDGHYCYLVDERACILPHARVGLNLKAELSESCATMSYEEATMQLSRHNAQLKVSK